MSEGYLAKDYNITDTGVSFSCANEARARVYDRCCALAKENIRVFGDRRVMQEGAKYDWRLARNAAHGRRDVRDARHGDSA